MTDEKIEVSLEKLEDLEKQTKDKFTKMLIEDLKKEINSSMPKMFKQLSFQRIVEIVGHENKKNKLIEFKKNKYKNIAYKLQISLRGGRKNESYLNGEFTLSEVSSMIQREFDLESMHLYEFEIGKYKFGPECDEWQEMFDSLDNFKLGAAISAAGLKKGDKFKFLYDFGDNIQFVIEILEIKKLNFNV